MNINALRSGTESEHRAAEKAMPILQANLTLPAYVFTLERLFGFVSGWEAICDTSAPAWMQPMMRLRRRAPLLGSDLQLLSPGFQQSSPSQMPKLLTDADYLGAMYVMEGSRLGGSLIARHVEKTLSLSPGQGNAYFRGAGAATGQLWMEFLEVLRNRVPDDQTEAVVIAAQEMFRFFTAWMQSDSPIELKERKAV